MTKFAENDSLIHGPKTEEQDIDEKINSSEKVFLSWVKMGAMLAIAVISLLIVVIYLLQLILPDSATWISAEHLDRLERFSITVVTGVASSLSISYFFKK